MDKRVLQEEPLKTVGSIIELFKDNMEQAKDIISQINRNSEETTGA